ncbi:MAG: hypothetical protein IKJ56_02245, partial [Bacteroidales bacterium]|nr:hypothetical protein [Bacteroidales bacterium]
MKNITFAIIAAIMGLASCSSNGDKPATTETVEPEIQKKDTLIAIQDCQHKMPTYVFAGQNDKLLHEILPDDY